MESGFGSGKAISCGMNGAREERKRRRGATPVNEGPAAYSFVGEFPVADRRHGFVDCRGS